MGYFAVLAPLGASKLEMPKVTKCHINLWSLPGIWPRRLLYFDLGLEIEASGESLAEFQVLLPFRVEEGVWPGGSSVLQDLYSRVTDQDTAELIFGGPVNIHQGAGPVVIDIGGKGDTVKLSRVHVRKCEISNDLEARPDQTLVKIVLDEPIKQNSSSYIRVRFRVFGSAPLWRWDRSSGGVQVDFRMCDVRESRFVNEERHLRESMLDIDSLNVFLMAPSRLVVSARSPEFRYVRGLEAGAWRNYLAGASYRGRADGVSVYYWRHKGSGSASSTAERDQGRETSSSPTVSVASKAINSDNPYRILLALQRPPGRSWYSLLLLSFLGALVALLAVRGGGSLTQLNLGFNWDSIRSLLALLVGTSLLAIITAYERLRGWAAGRFLRLRLRFRRLERWILRWSVHG